MQTIKKLIYVWYSCIQVSWSIDNTYLWLGIANGQGLSNRQRLAFHVSPSFNWCLPPSMLNSLPGKTNLKALYCLRGVGNAISQQKIFFFKNSISPGCLVHLPECILSIEERLSHVFVGGLIFKVCAWTSPGGNPSLTPTDQGSVPKFNKNSIRILSKSKSPWP